MQVEARENKLLPFEFFVVDWLGPWHGKSGSLCRQDNLENYSKAKFFLTEYSPDFLGRVFVSQNVLKGRVLKGCNFPLGWRGVSEA